MIAKLIERYFLVLILFVTALGLIKPDLFTWLKPHIALLLGSAMLGMGVVVDTKDLKEVVKNPKWILVGVVLQYAVNPITAAVICTILDLPKEIMMGMVIVGACPNGTSSNIISYLARGHLPLSITLTIINTFLSPLLTPLWIYLLLHKYIAVSLVSLIKTTFWIILFPLIDGLIIRRLFRRKIKFLFDFFPAFSIMAITLLIGCIVALNQQLIMEFPVLVMLAVVLHNLAGFALGYLGSWLCGFPSKVCRSMALEVGMHNQALGAALAMTHFNKVVALPSAFFSIWCNLSGTIFAKLSHNNNKRALDLINKGFSTSLSLEELALLIDNLSKEIIDGRLEGFYLSAELMEFNGQLSPAFQPGLDAANSYFLFSLNTNKKPEESYFMPEIIALNADVLGRIKGERIIFNCKKLKESLGLKSEGITSLVPLSRSNNTCGLIGFILINSPQSLSAYQQELVSLLTSYTSLALDRIRVYKKISRQEKELLLQKQKLLEDRAESMKALAGSIAHELRNPLNAISMVGHQLKDLAAGIDKIDPSNQEALKTKTRFLDSASAIADSVAGANSIINMILSDLKDKPLDPSEFSYLDASEVLPAIVKKYTYRSESEKLKVKLEVRPENSFVFKAVLERFTFIIYNLLKNALYYLKEYPDSVITVGIETARNKDKNQECNSIYVHDTGPGIPPHILPKLFDDFFSLGKKEGTGLGLAFCKRNMLAFEGDIICESEFGKWTKFSLLFPKISDEEVKRAAEEFKKREVWFIGDQISLSKIQNSVESWLPYLVCNMISASQALSLFREGGVRPHLALLLIGPVEDKILESLEVAREIKKQNADLPVVAYSSSDCLRLVSAWEMDIASSASDLINGYVSFLEDGKVDNFPLRAITKWLIGYQDDFNYLGEQYQLFFQGKRVILADDEAFNLQLNKRILTQAGLEVVTVKDGRELLEAYKNSLDKGGKSAFDVVITDINMPYYRGDKVAEQIRNIEDQNYVTYEHRIPIIALSGEGQKEDIYRFFDCRITDYFVKGSAPEILLKIIANCLKFIY